jgi:outer membrane protein W
VTQKHTLLCEAGFIRTSAGVLQSWPVATATNYYARHGVTGTSQPAESVLFIYEWDFRAIPISLSYEFYPRSTGGKLSPFIGIGSSFFFSRVHYKRDAAYEPDPYPGLHLGLNDGPAVRKKRDDLVGNGYGLHLYAGTQYRLSQRLLASFRLRVRYADGMAFTEHKHEPKVEFTGVDATLGLGWRF